MRVPTWPSHRADCPGERCLVRGTSTRTPPRLSAKNTRPSTRTRTDTKQPCMRRVDLCLALPLLQPVLRSACRFLLLRLLPSLRRFHPRLRNPCQGASSSESRNNAAAKQQGHSSSRVSSSKRAKSMLPDDAAQELVKGAPMHTLSPAHNQPHGSSQLTVSKRAANQTSP